MIHIYAFTFNPVQENTYILTNEKGEALIIDPGCYFTAEEEILQKHLKDGNYTPIQLLNTHCHFDHVFGNRFIADKYGLELYLHPAKSYCLNMPMHLYSDTDFRLAITKGTCILYKAAMSLLLVTTY